jgi:HD-GYP domain-containing protein (c-di-GMP phosphodiesterase class II)
MRVQPIKIHYPVRTLDGTALFAAASELTHEAIQTARKNYPPPDPAYHALLKHGSIFNDLQDLIATPPYRTIYSDVTDRNAVLARITSTRVNPMVLESLDYFRRVDLNTYRHALMVFALSILLARHLSIPDRGLEQEILSAGPTHDMGKICVPVPILSKSTPLTKTERRQLEHHAAAGFGLLAWHNGDADSPAARIARDHHERSNGTGYPRGIKLNDILVEIIAACDIYDALISPRPYRTTSFDNRTALEELTELAGKNYLRGEIIQMLIALNRKSRPTPKACVVSLERRGTPPADNYYGVTVADNAQPQSGQKP